MSTQTTILTNDASLRDRIAAALMILSALGAFYATITSVGVALAANSSTQQVEWWRTLGFLLFTGLFLLLAFGPRKYPGLWELIILDKAVLTGIEMMLISQNVANAFSTAIVDGILTVLIVTAYFLSKGYLSWKNR